MGTTKKTKKTEKSIETLSKFELVRSVVSDELMKIDKITTGTTKKNKKTEKSS